MTASRGSYAPVADGEAEAQRLTQQAAVVWARELTLLRQLGLPDRARLLDVGCGVGAVLGRLVEDTRPTLALGVDRERPHVTLAATVATVLRADATALPLADGCVDAALVRLVLRHVVDPPRLVREAARVLRPGGRLFVADADEESLFLDPPPPGFAALKAALLESVRRRGGDPVIGRRLRRLLLEAGLVRTRMAVLSVTTEDLPPASFLEVFLGRAVRPLDADLLTSADAARAWDAIGAWAARPDAFGCLTAVLGSGEREG